MATENLTVTIEGKEHTLYRDEILKSGSETMRNTFFARERTQADLEDAMLKVLQLKHALSSMDNTLQQSAVRYIMEKNAPAEDTKGEPNE